MKNKTFIASLIYAVQGIRHALARERNFKIHIICGIAAVLACIILQVGVNMFIWVVFAIFSVLCAELFNSAVEALTDLACGSQLHPLAKIAKDTAAAAVLLASVQALAVAVTIAVTVIGRWVNS
jgi:diacylglycerol kinase